jgi:hypothetical protein
MLLRWRLRISILVQSGLSVGYGVPQAVGGGEDVAYPLVIDGRLPNKAIAGLAFHHMPCLVLLVIAGYL